MNTRRALLTCLLLVWLLCPTAGAEDNWLLQGTVTWNTGTAAASVKLRLLQNGNERDTAYADQQGHYGFFKQPGQPGDYSLEVSSNGNVLRVYSSQALQQIKRGGTLDIQLQRNRNPPSTTGKDVHPPPKSDTYKGKY